jgi:hypothetical protein
LLTAIGWFVASNALKSPMVKSLTQSKVSFLLNKRQNLPPGVQCEAEIIPERSRWFHFTKSCGVNLKTKYVARFVPMLRRP